MGVTSVDPVGSTLPTPLMFTSAAFSTAQRSVALSPLKIDGGCAVPGFPGVWAVGDAAALEGPEGRAKQGHVAEIMARVAAENALAIEEGRPERKGYAEHLSILCLMDMGNGAAWVHRDDHRQRMIPLPVVGHWMKKGWGAYYRLSKRRLVPRLPGM